MSDLVHAISVITICYNNLAELEHTIRSVDLQTVPPYEHIIIDGSSNTEIKDHLESSTQPNYRTWVCEKDNGIADAFNKGIKRSTGNIVVMLNSGDTFFDGSTLEHVTNAFITHPSITWLHGKYQLIRANIHVIIGKPFEQTKLYRGMRSVSHQSMFLKRELHEKYGYYDTAENIGMDYDLLCRIATEPFVFLPVPLITFAPDGASSLHYLQSLRDAKRIYNKYYGNSAMLILWQWRLEILYHVLRSPVGNVLYKLKTKLRLENM